VDITLARTFLEIVACGSFVLAAERLHVTQTAVSARVRTLEEQLGRRLFVRSKSGAVPTPAGEQFVRHAAALIRVWEHARQQVALPPGRRALLTLGCEASLWDPLLIDWLARMRDAAPELALRLDVGVAGDLLDRVADGTVDVAVVYTPQQRPGLRIDLLIEERLVLVSTAGADHRPTPDDYVHVDWGPEFEAQLRLAFPELASAAISTSLGPLGLGHLLASGGAGYFRGAAVRRHLEAGRLHVVAGAPEFLYPAYAVYAAGADAELLAPALAALREVAGTQPPAAPRRARPRLKVRGRS
jgi:DNA-binding transcriptional LysR family regulator